MDLITFLNNRLSTNPPCFSHSPYISRSSCFALIQTWLSGTAVESELVSLLFLLLT